VSSLTQKGSFVGPGGKSVAQGSVTWTTVTVAPRCLASATPVDNDLSLRTEPSVAIKIFRYMASPIERDRRRCCAGSPDSSASVPT
jgi:hypothetical protein